jgi:hypothetical protein
VSLSLTPGILVIFITRRLGHVKLSITLDVYGHLIPSMQDETAQKIDEWVTPVEISKPIQVNLTAPGEGFLRSLSPYVYGGRNQKNPASHLQLER